MLFKENQDYTIYKFNPETDIYDRDELERRILLKLSNPDSRLTAIREFNQDVVSAWTGTDDMNAFIHVEGEPGDITTYFTDLDNKDHIEQQWQQFVISKISQWCEEVLGKTGTVKFNNFSCVRVGGGASLGSHIHPEPNDGIFVIPLRNRNLPLEFILCTTGQPLRKKSDIPEEERLSLFLEEGDILFTLPKIEHLLAPIPMGEETIYIVYNFRIEEH